MTFWYKKFKFGTHGNDDITGKSKSEVIFGLGGDDTIDGKGGDDVIAGGNGMDMLHGGAGRDRLYGEQGNDSLWGGEGRDYLSGGQGMDLLDGGTGNDVLRGGADADRFFFNPARSGEGHDRITDFVLGEDKIVLSVADVLASTPGLLAFAGNLTGFDPEDLDVSTLWNLSASHDGDLVVSHPSGAIELDGIKFAESLNFRAILPALELIA
jgi:Ca2+-binding RTX toxin-like protein